MSDRQFVESQLPTLPIGPAGDPVNFVDECVVLLKRWAATYGAAAANLDAPAYCCFVAWERVSTAADQNPAFAQQRHFRNDTPQNLLGRAYLCSPTLQSVYSKPEPIGSLEDVEQLLERLGAAGQPVVVFNCATKEVFWRTSHDASFAKMLLQNTETELPSEDFDEELNRFHVLFTATPQGFSRPWKAAAKLFTKEDLEIEIRDDLCISLKLKYPKSLKVSRESYEPTGRADLQVYFIRERVAFFLELKVLRAVKRQGERGVTIPEEDILDWGKMGVTQAHSYRLANDKDGVAYACCFDARGKNEEIRVLVDFANAMNVRYRRFYICTSSEEFHRTFMN